MCSKKDHCLVSKEDLKKKEELKMELRNRVRRMEGTESIL